MSDPTTQDVKDAVLEVKKGFEAFKEANDLRLKEIEGKSAADPLLEDKLEKINADLAEKQKVIDSIYAATKRKTVNFNGDETDLAELDAKALAWAQMSAKARGGQISEYSAENASEYKKAFDRYLRKDDRVLEAAEQKALSVGSDPNGGYLVSPDSSGRLVQQQYLTSPMRQYASVQVISSDSLEGIMDLDEVASGWVTETGARTETSTPNVGKWSIPVHEQYANPAATQKMVDDAFVDIEDWLLRKIADKFGRTEATAHVTGDGNGKPRGFLSHAAGTTNPGQIRQFVTAADGAFAADPDGADKLIDMIYGLKAPYRAGANWFANSTTLGGLRLMKDSDGRYLWQPAVQAGQPSTLLGYGVATLEDMPDYTTTDALALAFGDMAQAYQIVDRLGTSVLRDPYSNKPYIHYYATKRTGGDVINFEALNLLKFGS